MILGAVLAGGRSTRFGGDKAAALLAGRPLIEHAFAALAPHCGAVVVAGRDWPEAVTVADRPAPDMGPLGGLAGALHHAAAIGARAVLSVGCDTPHLPFALLAGLAARDDAAFVAALPVIGIWPAALAEALEAFVATDPRRSIRGWAATCGAMAIDGPQLANVNTLADLQGLAAVATPPPGG
jgi:molybdenum cofactor guanylyltransferase